LLCGLGVDSDELLYSEPEATIGGPTGSDGWLTRTCGRERQQPEVLTEPESVGGPTDDGRGGTRGRKCFRIIGGPETVVLSAETGKSVAGVSTLTK